MDIQSKKKAGRPSKASMAKTRRRVSDGTLNKVDKAKMNEFATRLLNSQRMYTVMDSIFEAALDDDSPKQVAAWNLLMDRALPKSLFNDMAEAGKSGNQIQINISTVGSSEISGEVIDGSLDD